MTEILDTSTDNDGELTQFLVFEGGKPVTKVASPENILLYDPKDELPFDGGLNTFVGGDDALKLSENPYTVVSKVVDSHSYILNISGDIVETTPSQAEKILDGIYQSLANDDLSKLRELHSEILSNQVRRDVVNALKKTFTKSSRIEITANGWLVDDFYLVDWNAKMYAANDDQDEADYVRSNGKAVKKDKSYEFVRLRHSVDQNDPIEVQIGTDMYNLTEREMLFLAKIKWLLHRRHYHPDTPFWKFADRWADVDHNEGNLDTFTV